MKTCVIIVAPLLEKIFRPEPHEAAEISEKRRNKNFWPEIPGADAAAVTALMHVLELLFSVYLSGEGSQVVKMERIVLIFFSISEKKFCLHIPMIFETDGLPAIFDYVSYFFLEIQMYS